MPQYVDPAALDQFLRRALEADIGSGDVTSEATIPSDYEVCARVEVREAAVIAGTCVASRVFALSDPDIVVDWGIRDGGSAAPGDVLGSIRGSARVILRVERLALNLMQRMSGIATATSTLQRALHPVRVRDTRKTAPGLNVLDKWAVLLGGGENHRMGLYDRMLIKNNHIAAAGGITRAIEAACQYRDCEKPGIKIEVEVHSIEELSEALAIGGFDELLLDNMVRTDSSGKVCTKELKEAVGLVGGRYVTEASGNITFQSAPAIAQTGVNYASSGALTHSVRAVDIALRITT